MTTATNIPSNWDLQPRGTTVKRSRSARRQATNPNAFYDVVDLLRLMGRKVELVDVEGDDDFYNAAVTFLGMYCDDVANQVRRNFDFLDQMVNARDRYHSLTWGQVKGVINCLRADMVRADEAAEKATQPAAEPVAEVTDGMYLAPDGGIFKVQIAVHGSGNLYAKRLVIDADATFDADGKRLEAAIVRFEFAPGMIRQLKAEWKMTLEQAKAFGALYGTCCNCGRTLTDETSIENGIGPVCAAKFG